MLERTAACIEPASQLFLRRIEPPIRSQRALGAAFWKNGGNQLDVLPWWPLYLKHIRATSKTETVSASSSATIPRRPSSPESRRRPRIRASKRSRTTTTSYPVASLRAYTKSTTQSQAVQSTAAAGTDEASEDITQVLVHEKSLGENAFRAGTDINASASQEEHTLSSHSKSGLIGSQHFADLASSRAAEYPEDQLRQCLREYRKPPSTPTGHDLDKLWTLFSQVPKRYAYAGRVFHLLAKSTKEKDYTRALEAFRSLDHSGRTGSNYELAVRVALKNGNYNAALSINADATRHKSNSKCSVVLLLHAISNRLWNTATSVWNTSLRNTILFAPNAPSLMRDSLVQEIGNYRDLPAALYDLGSKLRDRAAITMRHSGTLQRLFSHLLLALVGNGSMMSVITPEGLQNLLEISTQLHRAVPALYIGAIDTINKTAKRPDKGQLADAIYQNLRRDLPEWSPSPATFGSMLSIHAQEDASKETCLRYLNEFTKFHGEADLKSLQLVLTTFARRGDVDAAQLIFARLVRLHGYPTDPELWTPILYAYARLGDAPSTEREFRNMTNHGVKPNEYAWNILLYAYARSPQPEKAAKLLDAMKASEVMPDAYTFTTLASISAKLGDTDGVLDALDQAQRHGVAGSYELLTGLVQSYLLNDQAEAAERVAVTATKAGLRGYPTTLWNYLLRHYAFRADSPSMLRVQKQMTELCVEADAMTHTTFMTGLVVMRKTRDAVRILRRLNMSQTLSASAFQYAVILHGFAQEGDRDMANIVYNEMVERFPRLGASPRLAMLHLQAGRATQEEERPKHAALYLETILDELSTADRGSRDPQPGLRRRAAVEAVPALYLEYFAELLVTKGQTERAEKLLERFGALSRLSYLHLHENLLNEIPQLTTRLMVQVKKSDWSNMEATWNYIVERAIHLATRPRRSRTLLASEPATNQENVASVIRTGVEMPPPMQPVGTPESVAIMGRDSTFSSMLPAKRHTASPLDAPDVQVLYPQRFILEKALNYYLQSLMLQGLQSSAVTVVEQVQRFGFALTNKNWNKYIQVLAVSYDPEHWILAYELFEEKMIRNTPPWPILRRAKWLPPETSKGRSIPVRRKAHEQKHPEHLMPSYTTAVHLAQVLLKAHDLGVSHSSPTSMTIWKIAPFTCRYIRRMPYSKDRQQGILLRGRSRRKMQPRRVRFTAHPDRSGVLGSKSPAAHVPAEELLGLQKALMPDATGKSSTRRVGRHGTLKQIELYEGEMPTSQRLATKKRPAQSEEQFQQQIKNRMSRNLRIARRMRRDLAVPGAVTNMYIGHPSIPEQKKRPRTMDRKAGAVLYGTASMRLARQAQATKQTRRERMAALRRMLRAKRNPPP